MSIAATFVRSAAGAHDLPRDGLPEVALVGRSNVGKSSLINALVRQRVARTSAAPGKTRLVNIYRVERSAMPPLYLVDVPGYGYARGGRDAADAFDELTTVYFGQMERSPAALLLVDARHPGLRNDVDAWRWLSGAAERTAIVATKIDKLARGERIRALRDIESVFGNSVLPVSAVTGEGLDELWKLIDSLVNSSNSSPRPRSRRTGNSNPRKKAMAPRRPGPRS